MSQVAFQHGALYYKLTDVLVCRPGIQLPELSPRQATAILRSALASPTPVLATQLRGAFSAIDGGRAGEPKIRPEALADRIGTLVKQQRLTMVYYEPVTMLVGQVDEVPKGAPKADPSVLQRVQRVVGGLTRVPPGAVGAQFEQALTDLRNALTSSPALVILLGAVLAGWVASHATPPVGLAIDAALFGFAVYSLGMLAFDWAERLGKLVFAIGRAETDAEFDACSAELARLIVQIGISVFITLLLRAAGKKLSRQAGKPTEALKTAPARPATAAQRARPGPPPAPKAAAKPPAAKKPSARSQYMGGTPSKYSKTGREVVERMRKEGLIEGDGPLLKGNPNKLKIINPDGTRTLINEKVDMAHKVDAVKWWNETGRFTGPKSEQVRKFMLDADNYFLQKGSVNKSAGALLGETYKPPVAPKFGGPW